MKLRELALREWIRKLIHEADSFGNYGVSIYGGSTDHRPKHQGRIHSAGRGYIVSSNDKKLTIAASYMPPDHAEIYVMSGSNFIMSHKDSWRVEISDISSNSAPIDGPEKLRKFIDRMINEYEADGYVEKCIRELRRGTI